MPTIQRPLGGRPLRFQLVEEQALTQDAAILQTAGRNARTLVKEDGLRVTVVTLASGGEVASHHSDGPISIHCLEGDIQVEVDGEPYAMTPGTLVTLPAGLPHAVTSNGGGSFLLTVAWAQEAGASSTAF